MRLRIRLASDADRDGIRAVHLRAFPVGKSGLVASLAVELLGEASIPETIGVVAEAGGEVIGHVASSPVAAEGDRNWPAYVPAPLRNPAPWWSPWTMAPAAGRDRFAAFYPWSEA